MRFFGGRDLDLIAIKVKTNRHREELVLYKICKFGSDWLKIVACRGPADRQTDRQTNKHTGLSNRLAEFSIPASNKHSGTVEALDRANTHPRRP